MFPLIMKAEEAEGISPLMEISRRKYVSCLMNYTKLRWEHVESHLETTFVY